MKRSLRGPAKARFVRERTPGEFESCDLEVEAALREADLALAEAEMITVSQRNRKRIFDIAEAPGLRHPEPPVVTKELSLLL